MFKNIGEKIKKLAVVICWIGIVISLILGVLIAVSPTVIRNSLNFNGTVITNSNSVAVNIVAGILVFLIGSVASWISTFVLYGFGELVSNSKKILESMY